LDVRGLSVQFILAAAFLLLAAALRIADPGPVAALRLSVFDTYLRLTPRSGDPAHPVRIVDIDEQSLRRVGQWPWPRTKLAEIIDKLKSAGASTISVDLIFAEADRLSPGEFAKLFAEVPELVPLTSQAATLPSNDEKLAEAIAAAPVILGFAAENDSGSKPGPVRARFAFAGDDPNDFVPSFRGGIGSLPALTESAEGLGAVNWIPGSDQIVRRAPLLISVGGTLYPSLPLETLRISLGETTIFVRSSGGSGVLSFGEKTGVDTIRVGNVELPTDASGELWLRFSQHDRKRYISAHSVLDGTFVPQEVAGRHVLLGTSAVGLLDLRATPLSPTVPGVEIHAQALEQMLSGDHLSRPAYATGAELLFLIAVGSAIAWLVYRLGAAMAAIMAAVAIGAVIAASWFAYTQAGFLFDPVYPSLAVVLLYLATSLDNYVQTERDRSRVRHAFSHYVAAPLVEELARNHDKLKLGGEMREVTILFSDVRGFTKISEGMSAEALVRFVNELFTPLSEVILAQRGTIDKFMGDAVMAFWNAPLLDAEHACNASRAALGMISRLEIQNEVWAAEARSRGKTHTPVRIGIGLNTGNCCVGNVGSPERFDYSILGDVVNVASRLEGATKTYKFPIITGESTAKAALGFAFLEIDAVLLRGKDQPERIFALLGDETVAASEGFRKLEIAHHQLMAAISANDPAGARQALEVCRSLDWDSLAPLYETFEGRLAPAA
jgi:adenylate cyclase